VTRDKIPGSTNFQADPDINIEGYISWKYTAFILNQFIIEQEAARAYVALCPAGRLEVPEARENQSFL
jgi:hypothetical protein